mmetsp:Transcript_13427/g.36593  ORF Transcript_13427/g.36593 Transcript_13427/m.36593 type:complete len:225 (+) Transcript_13427:466-1140(+)
MSVCPFMKGPPTAKPMKSPVALLDRAWIQTSSDFTNHKVKSRRRMVCAPSKVVKCGSPKAAHNPGCGSDLFVLVDGGCGGGDGPGLGGSWQLLQQPSNFDSTDCCNALIISFNSRTSSVKSATTSEPEVSTTCLTSCISAVKLARFASASLLLRCSHEVRSKLKLAGLLCKRSTPKSPLAAAAALGGGGATDSIRTVPAAKPGRQATAEATNVSIPTMREPWSC